MDTSSLATVFLATALWIALAALAITGGPVLESGAWTQASSRQGPSHRTLMRVAPPVEVRGSVHLVGDSRN